MGETEARLEAEIAAVLQRLDEVNAAEDAEHGEDDEGSGGLPAELQDRPRRLATLQAVRAQLEREKGEALQPKHQKRLADQRMHRLLGLPWARRRYAKRQTQGEWPFAEITQAMGFRRCPFRGRASVWGEWTLVAAACNLRRLCALEGAPA